MSGIHPRCVTQSSYHGSCRLAEVGVGTIFCLQEDSDMAYFDLDINPIVDRCKQLGDIKHVRFPIRDFDPFSLRQRLPEAVATLIKEAASGRGKLYIHCTAGAFCTAHACDTGVLCHTLYTVLTLLSTTLCVHITSARGSLLCMPCSPFAAAHSSCSIRSCPFKLC